MKLEDDVAAGVLRHPIGAVVFCATNRDQTLRRRCRIAGANPLGQPSGLPDAMLLLTHGRLLTAPKCGDGCSKRKRAAHLRPQGTTDQPYQPGNKRVSEKERRRGWHDSSLFHSACVALELTFMLLVYIGAGALLEIVQ